jgi:hypothetical protein
MVREKNEPIEFPPTHIQTHFQCSVGYSKQSSFTFVGIADLIHFTLISSNALSYVLMRYIAVSSIP